MTGIGDIFLLFFMFAALQPILKQRLLESNRIKLMRRLEQMRKSRIIVLIHRQESMGFLGFPFFKFINIEDSEEVLRAIRMTASDIPIDIVLHTPGGLVIAADQIARALADHPAKVTAVVPHYAMSGGTLIALAADEILMDRHAILGPVDPQLGGRPAASIVRAVEAKDVNQVDDKTLIEADISKMALKQVRERVIAILTKKGMEREKAEAIAKELSDGIYTHDYPLTYDKLKELGLPVNDQFPPEFHELMALYPQPVQRQPSVEYFPLPYDKKSLER